MLGRPRVWCKSVQSKRLWGSQSVGHDLVGLADLANLAIAAAATNLEPYRGAVSAGP